MGALKLSSSIRSTRQSKKRTRKPSYRTTTKKPKFKEENAFAKMDELHDMGQSDEDYVKDYMKDKLDMEYQNDS